MIAARTSLEPTVDSNAASMTLEVASSSVARPVETHAARKVPDVRLAAEALADPLAAAVQNVRCAAAAVNHGAPSLARSCAAGHQSPG